MVVNMFHLLFLAHTTQCMNILENNNSMVQYFMIKDQSECDSPGLKQSMSQ